MIFTNNTPNNKFEINGRTPERGDTAFEVAVGRVNTIDAALDLASHNPSVTTARYNADIKARDAATTLKQQQDDQVQAIADASLEITNQVPNETFSIASNLAQIRANIDQARMPK